jgi:hypothetical protein
MSDGEERGCDDESQSDADADQELLPAGAASPAESGLPVPKAPLPAAIPIAPTFRTETIDGSGYAWASFTRPRLVLAAAIAAAAVLVGGAVLTIDDHRTQAGMIARQVDQTEALTRTIDALNARLNGIEATRSRDELAELRRSVSEIRSNTAFSRELSGAIAQLAERVEKLNRDGSARVDRLNERIDRQASARTAELAARVGKLEEKLVVSAAPVPAAAQPQKPSAPPPKPVPNVSMETTGSIESKRPVLSGYIVLGARDDVALVEGRNGERAVRRGDFLPGAGRVQAIARAGGSWIVLTERGRILAADSPN